MKFAIPFNKPYLSGKEPLYILESIYSGHISGNGRFTKRCHEYFEKNYGFKKALLTSSCTDALEMCAILLKVGPEDEILMPSYTFVSTANAFILRGAQIRFIDSGKDSPNIDPEALEAAIGPRTKVIVVVHYAGIACDMTQIMKIAKKHNLFVVEDAAHAVESYHQDQRLGTFGDLSTFSFHETKNIICGEGGLLAINNPELVARAEIIWEKGTNRAAFARNEVAKYNWVDIGSSFLASDISAAYLFAQLESINSIQSKRISLFNKYYDFFETQDLPVGLPTIPPYGYVNGHIFYLVCRSKAERTDLIAYLRQADVNAVFHYLPLHESPYFAQYHDGRVLVNCVRFADCLVRLPMYYDLKVSEVEFVCQLVERFFHERG